MSTTENLYWFSFISQIPHPVLGSSLSVAINLNFISLPQSKIFQTSPNWKQLKMTNEILLKMMKFVYEREQNIVEWE